jgi:hypothetical protein
MTLHIIIGILIGFGLYLLFSKRSQRANFESASNQNINNHHSSKEVKQKKSNRNRNTGSGCCG